VRQCDKGKHLLWKTGFTNLHVLLVTTSLQKPERNQNNCLFTMRTVWNKLPILLCT